MLTTRHLLDTLSAANISNITNAASRVVSDVLSSVSNGTAALNNSAQATLPAEADHGSSSSFLTYPVVGTLLFMTLCAVGLFQRKRSNSVLSHVEGSIDRKQYQQIR